MRLDQCSSYIRSEVFPKQRELKSKDDTEIGLNLPYLITKQVKLYTYDFEDATIEQFFEMHDKNSRRFKIFTRRIRKF